MARRFRLWEKKRGDRRTGSKLVGTAGEGLFFAGLVLFGAIGLSTLILTQELRVGDSRSWGAWVWLTLSVLASAVFIGAWGLIYTVLLMGTTVERRRAMAKRATDIDLLTERLSSSRDYPNVPRDVNLRNSPGIKLAYRLPIIGSPGWRLLLVAIFSLLWNAMVAVLVALAIGKYFAGAADPYLTALVIPFALIGVGALVYLFRLLFLATAIGPTSLEVSDHPLLPGSRCQVYLTQAGRLYVESLEVALVCLEEATYSQGTDTRTERRCVFRQSIFAAGDFRIDPSRPYESQCELRFPDNVMHSFRSDHNAIQWRLVVRGTVQRWSNFERVFPLVVYPTSPDAAEAPASPAA